MQTTITCLLELYPIVDLVNATRESVDRITREIAEMQTDFTKMNNEMWDTTHPLEAKKGGLRMSHK